MLNFEMVGRVARPNGAADFRWRVGLRLVAAAALGLTTSAWATPLTFQDALTLAEQRSPMLQARRAALEGAQQSRTAAGQLPDPKLAVGVENYPVSGADRFRWNRESMTMRRIGVMQEVPNAAKRAAQRESADAKAERERAMLEAERLAVQRETAVAWLAQHHAERKLKLFAALERENQVLQDTLAARIAGGKAMPADALMARQEALGLAERRDELQAAVDQASAALQRWTGSAGETSGSSPVIPLDTTSLLQRLARHGELLPSTSMLEMAKAEIAEAQASRRGDWGWELAYANRHRAYGDMVSFQLSFDLPVSPATRQDPQIAAKRKELDRLEAERDDALRRVRAELQSQISELQRLERALERQVSSVLPLLGERVQLTLVSYEGGRTDLSSVLTARKDAAEAQWRALDLEAQLMSQRARLAYLIAE
ncbi:TolC family protein [Piscinibacter gummiphilus]|uniref:TolC family protein n=1 Tax=Piscinibacter gummiphilus TaxID=946333 RepID=A0ABZ0D141_9BURK|nr:TolC family protein [Piscinibacter gummiphilus]WOB10921.1 TolC family protein [Piscinibacter gummiphilus]